MAGTMPNTTAVRMETAAVNASTGRSSESSLNLGKLGGAAAMNNRNPPQARRIPNRPPINERGRLSVTSWRTILQRPAPMAVRTAISVRRDAARANSRPATLAQPINSTNPTAPCSNSRGDRSCPYRDSVIVCTTEPMFLLRPGSEEACWAKSAAISACACLRDTPGFRRAATPRAY